MNSVSTFIPGTMLGAFIVGLVGLCLPEVHIVFSFNFYFEKFQNHRKFERKVQECL